MSTSAIPTSDIPLHKDYKRMIGILESFKFDEESLGSLMYQLELNYNEITKQRGGYLQNEPHHSSNSYSGLLLDAINTVDVLLEIKENQAQELREELVEQLNQLHEMANS